VSLPLRATWSTPQGLLTAIEPGPAEVKHAAARLADFYNDPHNAALLTNTIRFTPDDVVQLFADARAEGTRPLLYHRGGELVGDGDLRNITGTDAEIAVLLGPRALQGLGLGRRFATMTLALAYEAMGLLRVHAMIRPENVGSLRMFGALGFTKDDSPMARSFAEEDDDVCLSLGKTEFLAGAKEALAEIRLDVSESVETRGGSGEMRGARG
jgi:RimJ/RimL family protein N-acetyltransferase